MNFPNSFDFDIYKKNNIDLQKFNNDGLLNHYNNYGKNEGRKCSQIFDRNDLKKCIPLTSKCLEIGPFDCPVLTKQFNVKYFDVLTQDKLRDRAIKINRTNNLDGIPFIDYVSESGDLTIIDEKFDVVLSCHSIEHQPNLIKHLKDVSNLLCHNGCYIVILPDKRYCFDHFIKETTIADIIHMNVNSTKHTIKSVIEHRSLTCHNDAIRHWNNDHGIQTLNSDSILNAIKEYEESDTYIDVHSMQFTPSSFKDIIDVLNKMRYIDLEVDKIYGPYRNTQEFFAVLRKK